MTKRFFKYHLLLISILFFITRLLFLDRDLPPWDLTFYSGLDEMTYNIPAFNQYHYGTISYQVVEFLPADTDLHYSLLGNFMTYISLELFGNNYFGLRIAPIIASSIIIGLLLYFLYKMIDKNNATRLTKKFNLFCYIIISFYIIFNFSFLIASRVNEPTIFRTMTMIVIIYFALKMFPEDHDLKLTHVYFLGLLSCFGVLFVYLHNLFMVPAFGFFIIYLGYKKGIKEAITCGFIFLFGILCALEVFLFVFELVNDKTYWEMFLYLKNSPGWERRIGYLTTSSIFQVIKSIIRNGYLFWGTNIFRLDLSLLFLFLISLPIYLHKIVREKKYMDILVCSLILFLFMQSLFINDFSRRKLIIFFPLVVLTVSGAYIHLSTILREINNSKRFKRIATYYVTGLFVILMSWMTYRLTMAIINNYSLPDTLILILNYVSIFTLQVLIIKLLFNSINKRIIFTYIIILFASSIYLNSKYIFINPTFKYRDAMINVSDIIDGKKVAGDFSLGMRLYNDATFFVNPYRHYYKNQTRYYDIMKTLIEKNQVDYTFSYLDRPDYDDQWRRDRYYKLNELGFELIGKYKIQEVYGEIGLYKLK